MKKSPAILSALLIASVLAGSPGLAENPPAAAFNKLITGGGEAASILPGSTSPDGQVAVLFAARKKSLKPAAWPTIVPGAIIGQTDATNESLYANENWVVSLADKKKLGLVRSSNSLFSAVYGDLQLNEGVVGNGFSALWGPCQEGWYYGLLNYDQSQGCLDIFLVNIDGASAKITSIKKVLESAVEKFLVTRAKAGIPPSAYASFFKPVAVVDPASSSTANDPLTVTLGFTAAVAAAPNIPSIEGSMTVQFSRDAKGVATVRVLDVKPGRVQVPAPEKASAPTAATAATAPKTGAPALKDFAAFRKDWNARSKTDQWKRISKDLPNPDKGRKTYVNGWVEGTVLQRLMHVDSLGEGNESITLYYWRDGRLTSVFQLRTGAATQISEVAQATETYNFVNEKLVSWSRTGDSDTTVDPSDPAFQDAGKKVLKESIKFAQPIYQAIGAD